MQEEKPANRGKAITFTVLLHVILGAALILGIEFSDYRPLSGPQVDIVEAELITTPPAPRVDPEIERRRREQEAEEERRRQAEVKEQVRQQQEQVEAKKREQAEALDRKKAEAEAKRKAEQETKKKAEAAAKKKLLEEALRKKIEEEARQKAREAQQAQAEQQAREKALQEALAQEQRERELNPLKAAYSAAISQKIAQNWLRPPSITDDLKCEVLVTQLPDGSVTGARITRSSGNVVFDESVIKAIYKAAPLPPPPSPEVFDRELDIGFCSTGELC